MDDQEVDKLFLKAAGKLVRYSPDVKKVFFDFCFFNASLPGLDKRGKGDRCNRRRCAGCARMAP